MNTYTSSGIPSAAAEAGIGDEEGLTMMRNEGNEVEGGVERKRGEKFLTLRERDKRNVCGEDLLLMLRSVGRCCTRLA